MTWLLALCACPPAPEPSGALGGQSGDEGEDRQCVALDPVAVALDDVPDGFAVSARDQLARAAGPWAGTWSGETERAATATIELAPGEVQALDWEPSDASVTCARGYRIPVVITVALEGTETTGIVDLVRLHSGELAVDGEVPALAGEPTPGDGAWEWALWWLVDESIAGSVTWQSEEPADPRTVTPEVTAATVALTRVE